MKNKISRENLVFTFTVLTIAILIIMAGLQNRSVKAETKNVFKETSQLSKQINASGSTACVVPPSGMVSWWRAEGNANDNRRINNGTLQNGVTFGDGKVGQAFSFDGVDDFVFSPDSNSLDLTGDLTFETWINPTTIVGDQRAILSKREFDNSIVNYAFFLQPTGRLTFYAKNGGNAQFIESIGTVPINTFTHVAVIINNSLVSLYINGEIDSVTNLTVTRLVTSGRLTIGKAEDVTGAPNIFEGSIDELSIYNRALPQTEIQSIFNAGSAGKCGSVETYIDFDDIPAGVIGDQYLSRGVKFFVGNDQYGNSTDILMENGQPVTATVGNFGTSVSLPNVLVPIFGSNNDIIVQFFDCEGQRTTVNSVSIFNDTQNIPSRIIIEGFDQNGTSLGQTQIEGASQGGTFSTAGIYKVKLYSAEGFGAGPGYDNFSYTRNEALCCATLPPGAISWWKGENNANDSIGNNHGTLQNGATFGTGKVGQAFNFDGIDDLVSIPNSPNLDLRTAITLEAWVKTSEPMPPATKLIVGKSLGYQLVLLPSGRFRFAFPIGGGGDVNQNTDSTTVISPNVFTHIVGTYNALTGQSKIYVNGILENTLNTSGNIDSTNSTFEIGGFSGFPLSFLNGVVDEPTLYNRAISGSEILAIFNAGSSGKCFLSSSRKFDFDGDSKTDVSIFRPSLGQWWYLRSSDLDNRAYSFGLSTDTLIPADFTGDGKTDIAFWRESSGEWFILRSEDSSFYSVPFGTSGDIPAPGDFDGDGMADTAVFRPSTATWFIQNSSGGTTITGFGIPEDKPVVADYDGDGKDDIAIFRPSVNQWWLNRSTDGVLAFEFGTAGDKTVQGDYTGDGKADAAFYRPSSGEWFVLRSEDLSFYSVPFGISTDIPTAGDYDGDGKTDTAVFRPSNNTWFYQGSMSGSNQIGFGQTGDIPIPNVYSVP